MKTFTWSIKNILFLHQKCSFNRKKEKIMKQFQEKKAISELLDQSFVKYSMNDAICYAGTTVTYKQLKRYVQNVLFELNEIDAHQERKLYLIYTDSPIVHIISQLAVLKKGGVCVPLDQNAPLEYYHLHRFDNIACIITDKVQLKEEINWPIIFLSEEKLYECCDDYNYEFNTNSLDIDEDLSLYCIMTSGTTNAPKAVLLKQAAILNQIEAKINVLDMDASSRICVLTNFSFVATIWQILSCLILGGCIVKLDDDTCRNPVTFLSKADYYRSTIVCMTPSYVRALIYAEKIELKSITTFVLTGEILDSSLAQLVLSNYKVKLINAYGQTETSDDTFHYVFSDSCDYNLYPFAPIGSPISNIEYVIINKNNDVVLNEGIGELCISGVCLFDQYLGDAELTEKQYISVKELNNKRFFRSGDLVSRSNGELVCHGRIDNQIKVNGFRIEPELIETYSMRFPGVRDAVVINTSTEKKNYLHLLYRDDPDINVTPNELREYLKKVIPSYMLPSIVSKTKNIVYSNNGKKIRSIDSYNFTHKKKIIPSQKTRITKKDIENIVFSSLTVNQVNCSNPVYSTDVKIKDVLNSLEFIYLIVDLENMLNIEFDVNKFSLGSFSTFDDIINYCYVLYLTSMEGATNV